jgi:cathepsin D
VCSCRVLDPPVFHLDWWHIVLVNQTQDLETFGDTISGIAGLGLPGLTSTRSIPFWHTILKDTNLNEMSFFMDRHIGDTPRAFDQLNDGGIFTMGGRNTSLYTGNVEFLYVTGNTFWLLTLKTLSAQGNDISFDKTAASVAIDTGTSLIGGPSGAVAAFWKAVPGSAPIPQQQGLYGFPCSTDIQVSVSFGGKTWAIDSRDMNLGLASRADPDTCVGVIFDIEAGTGGRPRNSRNPSWIFGDTFLKNVYSVFRLDPTSVGFALLGSGGTNEDTNATNDASAPRPGGSEIPNSVVTSLHLPTILWPSLALITSIHAISLLIFA